MDQEGVRLGEHNIGFLSYADDIVFLSEKKRRTKKRVDKGVGRNETYRIRNEHRKI